MQMQMQSDSYTPRAVPQGRCFSGQLALDFPATVPSFAKVQAWIYGKEQKPEPELDSDPQPHYEKGARYLSAARKALLRAQSMSRGKTGATLAKITDATGLCILSLSKLSRSADRRRQQ